MDEDTGLPIPGEDNYRKLCIEKTIPFLIGSIKALTARIQALENP